MADASDEELLDFLVNFRAPDALDQIRRARERISKADDLSQERRKELTAKCDRVLAQIETIDPLFRIQIQRFAVPKIKSKSE